MGLADEVDFELECSRHETPSATALIKYNGHRQLSHKRS